MKKGGYHSPRSHFTWSLFIIWLKPAEIYNITNSLHLLLQVFRLVYRQFTSRLNFCLLVGVTQEITSRPRTPVIPLSLQMPCLCTCVTHHTVQSPREAKAKWQQNSQLQIFKVYSSRIIEGNIQLYSPCQDSQRFQAVA